MIRGNLWSENEDAILRDLWKSYADKQSVVASLPGRSYRAVTKRAFKLGITRPSGLRCHRVPNLFETVTDCDAAWVAGFVDGEGTIGLDSSRGIPHAYFAIANTNRKSLEYVREVFGYGCIAPVKRPNPTHKDGWCYRVNAALWVEAVVRRIKPYLRIKNCQAGLVLEYIRLRKLGVSLHRSDNALFIGVSHNLNRKGKVVDESEIIVPGLDPEKSECNNAQPNA